MFKFHENSTRPQIGKGFFTVCDERLLKLIKHNTFSIKKIVFKCPNFDVLLVQRTFSQPKIKKIISVNKIQPHPFTD